MGTPSVFGMSPAASTPACSEAASLDTASGLDTAATTATAAGAPGAGAHPAPWGTVCLGLLLQRCSDKSAAIRARALHHLAEAVHAMLASLGVLDPKQAEQCRQVRYLLMTCHFHIYGRLLTAESSCKQAFS